MKKIISLWVVLLVAVSAFAQKDNPLVGVWQQVVAGNQTTLTIGPNGKVFLPDGRMFGYFLNPTEFDKFEQFNFAPWILATYKVTGDSTYSEQIYIHNSPDWEGTINFRYKLLNSRTLFAQYEHTYPDGSVRTITDLWVRAVYDKEEQEKVIKKVMDNWSSYEERAKTMYGRY